MENIEKEKVLWAPDQVGHIERFELCDDGQYHWHGEVNYAGFTYEELEERINNN